MFTEFANKIPTDNLQEYPLWCPSNETELVLQSNNFSKEFKYVTANIQI